MTNIANVKILGFEESIKASKYPMSIDVDSLNTDITNTVDKLAKNPAGTGHNNFLSGIVIQFDLTFSNKAWVEFERYHFAQIVSSQSTMHRISRMDIKKTCNRYVDDRIIDIVEQLKAKYLETQDKEDYLTLLYNIPSGLELTARISTNYLQLKTIYKQRRTHRLPDWQVFCDWIETLPHSEWLTGEVQE